MIWLIKASEDTDDGYSDQLTSAGFFPKQLPALTFSFINQAVFKEAFNDPNNHTGIVFTSPRAAQALGETYKQVSVDKHKEWLQKKIFVIGPTTSINVKQLFGFNNLIGENSSTAKNLFPIIEKETVEFDKPLLIPCSNLKRDELPKLLANANRDFRSIVAYETKPHPLLDENVKRLLKENGVPDYVVFFSPSGVNNVLPILKKNNVDIGGLKCIAIGPTTNSALTENNMVVVGVCPTPSPEGLIHTLKGL